MSPRTSLVCGAILGAIGVACGAFGAHALRESLEATGHAATWETGCRYMLIHALALVAVGTLAAVRPSISARLGPAAWCFLAGTVIFSGCLLTLALTGVKALGAIVPIGGAGFIAGWLLLAVTATHADS